MTEATQLLGVVDDFIEKGGFGFILTDDGEKFFFHRNQVPGRKVLRKGSILNFDRLKNSAVGKHDRAINIQILHIPD